MADLNDVEQAWLDWTDSLPREQRIAHDRCQAISLAAFAAGQGSALAKVRQALLGWLRPTAAATDRINGRRIVAEVDRIAPRKVAEPRPIPDREEDDDGA